MNVKDYIESGIIERYVLGLATPEQEEELTYLRMLYPELEKEVGAVELRVEEQVLDEAVMPPAKLKRAIFKRMDYSGHSQDHYRRNSNNANAYTPPEPVYINANPGWNRSIMVSIWWRCAFVAMCILSMSLAASTWYLYHRTTQLEEVLIKLKSPAVANPLPASH
ncbi:hypothetical protein [Chitinophaga sp. MM2321]|uniref:hypothetical protein n=1 Tax=Chitinophaga sp. MM2321 TaxID=3137178 RepID=UPI0032D57F2F